MIYAQRATKEYPLWVEGTAHYQLLGLIDLLDLGPT